MVIEDHHSPIQAVDVERGALEHDPVAPLGAREVGIREVGAREAGAREAGIREVGIREAGAREAGIREVGAREAGAREAGIREVGIREVGAREVGAREIGAHEVGAREAGAREVGIREVGTRFNSLLQRVTHRQAAFDAVRHFTLEQNLAAAPAGTLANIERLLDLAGTDKTRLLSVTIYLKDIDADFAGMNAVWDKWLPKGVAP